MPNTWQYSEYHRKLARIERKRAIADFFTIYSLVLAGLLTAILALASFLSVHSIYWAGYVAECSLLLALASTAYSVLLTGPRNRVMYG
jgi:hypothetical protein